MSFQTMNNVAAARGMAGTSRPGPATFSGYNIGPTGAHTGMSVTAPAAPVAPTGSSYSRGAGMQAPSGMAGGGVGGYLPTPPAAAAAPTGIDSNGLAAGQSMPMANVGQAAPQMSAADMQDPNNAAMAGFAYSRSQDAPVQASQQPQQVAAPMNAAQKIDNPNAVQRSPTAGIGSATLAFNPGGR